MLPRDRPLISWLKNTVMDGYFLSFRRCCTPYVGIHFFTKKAESTGAILFRRSPQSGQFTIIRISAALPSPVDGRQLESEHFLQHRLAVHIGQDSSLLDGVVMLVEGEGAGDAVDAAGCPCASSVF